MTLSHEENTTRNPQIFSIHRKKGRPEIASVNHARSTEDDAVRPKKEKVDLTQAELKRLLHYDPETGVFTWRVRASDKVRIGQIAGCTHGKGYRLIRVLGRLYLAHRLVWLYMRGETPPKGVDHINGVRDDNRMANLRRATHAENNQNQRKPQPRNRSGFLGVCPHSRCNRWVAQISLGNKTRYIGLFPTPKEAHQAYLEAKRDLHPFGTI